MQHYSYGVLTQTETESGCVPENYMEPCESSHKPIPTLSMQMHRVDAASVNEPSNVEKLLPLGDTVYNFSRIVEKFLCLVRCWMPPMNFRTSGNGRQSIGEEESDSENKPPSNGKPFWIVKGTGLLKLKLFYSVMGRSHTRRRVRVRIPLPRDFPMDTVMWCRKFTLDQNKDRYPSLIGYCSHFWTGPRPRERSSCM